VEDLGVQSIAVNLEAQQYLTGWRPDAGRLFVPVLSDSRLGEDVAVRVGIIGQTIRATVFGKIESVRRVGRPSLPPGVDLALDAASFPAAIFLAMSARGEHVTFRERAPRYVVERILRARSDGGSLKLKTINVSEGGCAVEWPGPPPLVGSILKIKVGHSFLSPSIGAVVCWSTPGVTSCAGLCVVAKGRGRRAWRLFTLEVARSGVQAA
jgi:hypothetical protein